MKTAILFAICIGLSACTTFETTNPDGSVTKTTKADVEGMNAGVGLIGALGNAFGRNRATMEVTATK